MYTQTPVEIPIELSNQFYRATVKFIKESKFNNLDKINVVSSPKQIWQDFSKVYGSIA